MYQFEINLFINHFLHLFLEKAIALLHITIA